MRKKTYLCHETTQLTKLSSLNTQTLKDMATFDFALLNQGHVVHNRDWNFGPICSRFTRIYWIDKGYAHMTFDGHKHKLTEGHLYLIPALTTHTGSRRTW